jgi:glucan phosphoethanolaminetransferase (alkaline phosphatase superfamily)
MTSTSPKSQNLNWRALIIFTIYSAYFYAFMEWLFFVTKPSSLSILSFFEKIRILFVTGGIVALTLLACLLILSIPTLLVRHPAWGSRLRYLAYLAPALILGITALLMLDNFTYTVFNFGIISTEGGWRVPYTIGFIIIVAWISRQIQRRVQKRRTPASFPALGLLIVSIACILSVSFSRDAALSLDKDSLKSSAARPNIIILGGDGLSANFLSVYGYTRDTTPFLKEMAKTSLVAENAFPNASSTTASTTTMMTGREPANVKVYRYPDVLKGNDSFEHLPGILKRLGYTTVQVGTPFYVDAQKLNLLDGFDIVNNQSLNQPALTALRAILGNSPSTYFIWTIKERASERLLHIFFIRTMENPLKEVNNPEAKINDTQRVQQILDAVDQATPDHPAYVFAHLMDTHGPHFSSDKQVFSTGPTDEEWDKDLYQDAILSFDGSVEKIYKHLEANGQLDNTILVIYTDHGFKYTVWNRIPMIMHFPKGAHAGTREHNIQVIDAPATLLDYLGIPQPSWMTGASFLNEEPQIDRQIVSIVAGSPSKIKPPFYQIKIVQVLVCQKWYELNVQENKFDTGIVTGYVSRCSQDLLPSEDEIHQKILDYLKTHEYDISSLQ